MTNTFETLEIQSIEPGAELVRMARPASLNALNTQMGRDLFAYFEAIAMNPAEQRCVILTGSGDRAFCAGGDLKERNGMTDEAWRLQHVVFERMARAILDCPIPVIAAVNGVAYGGGAEIAGCCDFIYAAETARFAFPEIGLGIIPGGGGTQTLARAVGERKAKELIFTGRSFGANEAQSWGLVNVALPFDELLPAVIDLAMRIASGAPLAVRQAKQAIHRGLQMSLRDGLTFEIEAYNRLIPTDDRREGVLAFNERRAPQFRGR